MIKKVQSRQMKTAIIPEPAEVNYKNGVFNLSGRITVVTDNGEYSELSDYLLSELDELIPMAQDSLDNSSIKLLKADDESLSEEGYRLSITSVGIVIAGKDNNAVFYGIMSLLQLVHQGLNEGKSAACLACAEITDFPRFSWRGFMLDESRHFQGKETVKELLDFMAYLKLNKFHWHLTDDQGWRIEIKAFPELTSKGGFRPDTTIGGYLSSRTEGVPHQGFYTQDDIRDIISYAAGRGIEVIPEIEVPGHSLAALSVFPELSCRGRAIEITTKAGGIFRDIYCAGKEETFVFLQTVLDEICSLFPSSYIHIGGDEAPVSRMKKCPDCRRRMEREALKTELELQHYMSGRIAAYLISKGKTVIGWNEILSEQLEPTIIAQFWQGNRKELEHHMSRGRKIIRSDYWHLYLDLPYRIIPLWKTYSFEPGAGAGSENILGLEAPMWTEWVPDKERLYWQIFPRLCAAAETAWTPAPKKDWNSFSSRLEYFLRFLEFHGAYAAGKRYHSPGPLGLIFKYFFFLWDSGKKLHKKDLKRRLQESAYADSASR